MTTTVLKKSKKGVPKDPNFMAAVRKARKERFIHLSTPKWTKAVWETTGPKLVWGNQEAMQPISEAALKAKPTERLSYLATPKKNFMDLQDMADVYVYSCGRSSQIWEVSPGAKQASPSRRIEQLAEPKQLTNESHEYKAGYILGCGRSSTIWQVSPAAMEAQIRSRTERLAQPKTLPDEYQLPRTVQWPAKRYGSNCPERFEYLSQHKSRSEGLHRPPESVVTKAARSALPSPRITELALPKKITDGYEPCFDSPEFKVPRSALNAQTNERIDRLALPIVRASMDNVQFDKEAFKVKQSALTGKVPSRINELAEPIIRGPNMNKK